MRLFFSILKFIALISRVEAYALPTRNLTLERRQNTEPYGAVPLGSLCPYMFYTINTFDVGDKASISGSIGLDTTSAGYGGITLTMSSDGRYCMFPFTFKLIVEILIFSFCLPATAPGITGQIYATDYNSPTPFDMASANNDLGSAIQYASQESPPTYSSAAAGTLDGMTLNPGIYQWAGALTLSTTVILQGSCGDIFVFQIG